MKITFTVTVKATGKPREIVIGEEYKEYVGNYVVKELSAYEANEALNVLIASNKKFQENPELIKPIQVRKAHIEKATTLNDKPLQITDLKKFPNKLWQVLIGANEVLNSVSLEEARFLLKPLP